LTILPIHKARAAINTASTTQYQQQVKKFRIIGSTALSPWVDDYSLLVLHI